MKFKSLSALLVPALLIMCAATAPAATVQVNFVGTVTGNNSLNGSPAIGTTFNGNFVIDPSIITGEGPNCSGTPFCWSGSADSFTWAGATINSSNAITPGAFGIIFSPTDSAPGAGSDVLVIHLDGYGLNTITLTLSDSTGTAFENGGGLNLFASKQFTFTPLCVTGIGCVYNPYYSGTLEFVTDQPVPEPASALLLGGGLLGLAGLTRRKRS